MALFCFHYAFSSLASIKTCENQDFVVFIIKLNVYAKQCWSDALSLHNGSPFHVFLLVIWTRTMLIGMASMLRCSMDEVIVI